MPPMEEDVTISELEEFEPSRVDGVGKGANGFPILMLKSIDGETAETETTLEEVLTDLDKSEREKCDACDGMAKSIDDCKKCFGTGILPRLGETPAELVAAAKQMSSPSGAPTPAADKCPTCHGNGLLKDGKTCPDCDGSGKDSTEPPSDKLARVDGDGHHIHEGDTKGREKIDKATIELCDQDDCEVCKELNDEELEKAKLKAKARNALPDSSFALPGRRYPIHDISHARNALARVSQYGTPEEKAKVRAAVHRRYPEIESATKASSDGTTYSAPNPALAAMAQKVGGDDSDTSGPENVPGSPEWEAVDAETATSAAVALMAAAECLRTFAQREAQEVAAGEGSDCIDVYDASQALCAINDALGIAARLAFHEGLAAAKSLDDEEIAEKAGKRLSRKSVESLAAVRNHITDLLGDDDPNKTDEIDDGAEKSVDINMDELSKEIEDMDLDELTKWADARDEKLVGTVVAQVAETLKGTGVDTSHAADIANAKNANNKAKNKKPKAEMTDLEDEHADGDNPNGPATGAAKSEGDGEEVEVVATEPSPEEVEAQKQIDEAKRLKKEAKKALKKAAQEAQVAREIREGVEKATEAFNTLKDTLGSVDELQQRLATVEKNVSPSEIRRTAPPVEESSKDVAKSRLESEISYLEKRVAETGDMTARRGYQERLRDAKEALANS